VNALRQLGRNAGVGGQTLRTDRGNARGLGLGLGLSRQQRGLFRNSAREGQANLGLLNDRQRGRFDRLLERGGRRGQTARQLVGTPGLTQRPGVQLEQDFV
jgi:hypothetical protein